MGAAVVLRGDFGADDLRRFAGRAKDAAQARRLLALAAVLDGMNRIEAARIGGMDRQTLRDWVHRFNQYGPDGLIDIKPSGCPPRLSDEQKELLKQLVAAGPDSERDGGVSPKQSLGKRVRLHRNRVHFSRSMSASAAAGARTFPSWMK